MGLNNPLHPGKIIRELYIQPLGLTVTQAAAGLGVTRKTLSLLLNGHAGISPEMAIRLSKAFGRSAESWLQLQLQYDLAQARQRADQFDVTPFLPPHPQSACVDAHEFDERFQQHFDAESEIGHSPRPGQEASAQSSGCHVPPSTPQSHSLSAYTTEQDLLRRLQDGDEAAWAQFFGEWSLRLFGYLKYPLPTPSDVEDVLSATFLAIVRAIRTFDGKVTLATFCYSIAHRKVADFWRRQRDASERSVGAEFESPSEVLARLPQRSQQVLLLRYNEGLRIEEIAQIFGYSYKATESMLKRARTLYEQEMTRGAQT